MADRFGPRGVFAIMVPLQNSNMQPEYEAMRPDGVSNQVYRFDISQADAVPEAVLRALPGTRFCWPDTVICGNSVEMRHWSVERQARYRTEVADAVPGVPVVTATDACEAALRTLDARRISVLSPMFEANAATYWYALRRHGIADSLDRGGRITRMPLPSEFAREDPQ